MKLMEILEEVQLLESINNDEEKLIQTMKENYKSSPDEYNFDEFLSEGVSISAAKKSIKQLEKTAKEKFTKIKSAMISGFMSGDVAPIKKLLASKPNTKLAVDYLQLLKAAHGGEKKLMSKAEGKGKAFFKKVFGLVDKVAEA